MFHEVLAYNLAKKRRKIYLKAFAIKKSANFNKRSMTWIDPDTVFFWADPGSG